MDLLANSPGRSLLDRSVEEGKLIKLAFAFEQGE